MSSAAASSNGRCVLGEAVGFAGLELKAGGFTVGGLKTDGFAASELKAVGTSMIGQGLAEIGDQHATTAVAACLEDTLSHGPRSLQDSVPVICTRGRQLKRNTIEPEQ